MTNPLSFDDLQAILHQGIAHLPDHRQPSPNTRYTMQDAALGAFGIFFTQSPSFLEYQRQLQASKGRNNAQTLFGVQQIPCDNQIRTLLDPIAPGHFDPIFLEVFKRLNTTTCATVSGSLGINFWLPWMARPTSRPKRSIATTV